MKKVLLADDNADIVELVKAVLEDAGYQLLVATDGQQAVEMALQQKPDLVLMDLKMPKVDGLAATRALRQSGFSRPIVVLTASEKAVDRSRATKAGCDGYVVKTLEMADMREVLFRYLGELDGSGDAA